MRKIKIVQKSLTVKLSEQTGWEIDDYYRCSKCGCSNESCRCIDESEQDIDKNTELMVL